MDARRMLARLDRVLTEGNVSVTKFLLDQGLAPSTFYKIRKSKTSERSKHEQTLQKNLGRDCQLDCNSSITVTVEDVVNSPSHYKVGGVECIDVMIQLYGLKRVQEYAEIAAFKYAWREGRKGDSKD
jgi:predicted transcriptional regulator